MGATHRPLRFVVGTVLLASGGGACTSAETTHVNPGPQTIAPDVKPPAPVPEKTPSNGGCEPPDCHINPGPVEPQPQPQPKPEPKIMVDPGPDARPPSR